MALSYNITQNIKTLSCHRCSVSIQQFFVWFWPKCCVSKFIVDFENSSLKVICFKT